MTISSVSYIGIVMYQNKHDDDNNKTIYIIKIIW